ncbi:MAG: hypothetical protein M1831_004170 [Alyxoria varia]|nr:MAG: hypothetical protein M1831_004170 [Alyxoria varia]
MASSLPTNSMQPPQLRKWRPRTWRPKQSRWYAVVYLGIVVGFWIVSELWAWPWAFPETFAHMERWKHPLGHGHKLRRRDAVWEKFPDLRDEWYPPKNSPLNSLWTAAKGSGSVGFDLDPTSQSSNVTDNWCNMPHVNPVAYKQPDPEKYQLKYVELIHSYHKRTPYHHSMIPHDTGETEPFDCDNVHSEEPPGTCNFPQISRGGLDNSLKHGMDLYTVYHDIVSLIPDYILPETVGFRVTNNPLTWPVARKIMEGWADSFPFGFAPLHHRAADDDSLEPTYPCSFGEAYYRKPALLSNNPADWEARVNASRGLYERLDWITGIDSFKGPSWSEWHDTWDHYFDYLSAQRCHDRPLPCSQKEGHAPTNQMELKNQTQIKNPQLECVSEEDADAVFRLGHWEYDWIHRSSGPKSLAASVASFGVWVQELLIHFKGITMFYDTIARSELFREELQAIEINKILDTLPLEERKSFRARVQAEGVPKIHERIQAGELPGRASNWTEEHLEKEAIKREREVSKYKHHVAHDGSIARLLSILQVEEMIWPGMGAEVVFELYSSNASESGNSRYPQWFVRILWDGRVLRSSHPDLQPEGDMEGLLRLDRFGEYLQKLGIGISSTMVNTVNMVLGLKGGPTDAGRIKEMCDAVDHEH